MCGIVGARDEWLRRRGLSPAAAMQGAVDELRWRGPDGQGVAMCGGWWLGCARLSISRADSDQPVARRGGRFAGVMNGAVTNARALWARWCAGVERRAAPPNDAWLPLLAVERDGRFADLRGHHAFAVVDAARDELHLGRDRYGEKPLLCVYERRGGDWSLVAFGSTPRALARLGVALRHDEAGDAEWFRCGWSAWPSLRGDDDSKVVAFEPGYQRFGPGGVPTGAHERPSPARDAVPASASEVRGAVVASVARCIDTPAAVGLSLSGGLDSSCLALALAELGASTPAYQFCADGAATDERDAARAAAAAANLPLREVTGGPELLDALPRLTHHAGRPLGDPSILAAYAVARRAAADGVRVLLGGEGADELMLGYRRHRLLARLRRLPFRRALHRLVEGWSMRPLARALRAATADDPVAALYAVTPPAFGREVLAPELAAAPCWRDAGAAIPAGADLLAVAQDADLTRYLAFDLLPKIDVAGMAAGVEGRCPYLEGDLDAGRPTRTALGKRALRAAFADALPAAVRALKKRGFGLPLDAWFRGDTPWLDVLLEARSQQRRHLRPGGMRRAIDLHRGGRADLGHGLYLLLAYELFLRSGEPDGAGQSA